MNYSLTSSPRSRSNRLLPETRDVPDSDSLVQTGADHQVLGWVELSAHDVVVVPGQHADALPALPVPDPHCLVIRAGEDPGILVVEHRGSDVVQVTQKSEDTPPLLVVPHLDLVIISSRHEQRLLFVEVNSSHRSIMLIKLV